MEDRLQRSLHELAAAIEENAIYQRYKEAELQLERNPSLKTEVNDYRKDAFQVHNGSFSEDELFDKTEKLLKKYENLRKKPLANEYLEAELDMCQLMKKVHTQISLAVPFSTPWEGMGSSEWEI